MGDQQKLVVINEKEQYSVQKLFNIGDNLRVKQFLLQVCYTAIEEIGFEKFDIQSNYEDFLARLCVDLTQFSDSTGGSSLQAKSLYRSPAVGDFYGTGIEFWAGFGPVGIKIRTF